MTASQRHAVNGSGMGEALLSAESGFSGEPVLHVMTIGSAVVLVVQVSAGSHRLSGRGESMCGGRRMRRVAVVGFGGGFRGGGRCVLFHGIAMLLSLKRFDHGVNAHFTVT